MTKWLPELKTTLARAGILKATLMLASFSHLSCNENLLMSTSQDQSSDKKDEGSNEKIKAEPGVNEPEWLNGSYLVNVECMFKEMKDSESVTTTCDLTATTSDASLKSVDLRWAVYNDAAEIISDDASITISGTPRHSFTFTFPGKDAEKIKLEVYAVDNGTQETAFQQPLLKTLPSEFDTSTLTECLLTQTEMTFCYFRKFAVGTKRAFATSKQYPTLWTTLSQADTVCQKAADEATLGGRWIAFIASTTEPYSQRFSFQPGSPVENLLGEIVYDEAVTLHSQNTVETPLTDELKTILVSGSSNLFVATGIRADGTIGSTCTEWSAEGGNAQTLNINPSVIGTTIVTDCSVSRLFCIEP